MTCYACLDDPLGLKGSSGHFPNALEWAVPTPEVQDKLGGLEHVTARAVARERYWQDFGHDVRFVDEDVPSTGNLVVSVNPIDAFTWAATALASNGRCYALLVAHDRVDPEYGAWLYGKFPIGMQCEARFATRETVRLGDPPE